MRPSTLFQFRMAASFLAIMSCLLIAFPEETDSLECYVGFAVDHVGFLRQCEDNVPCIISFNPGSFYGRGCGKKAPDRQLPLVRNGCYHNMTRTNGKFICACDKDRCNDWVLVPST